MCPKWGAKKLEKKKETFNEDLTNLQLTFQHLIFMPSLNRTFILQATTKTGKSFLGKCFKNQSTESKLEPTASIHSTAHSQQVNYVQCTALFTNILYS